MSQFKSTSPQVKQRQIQTARRPVSHETGISKVIIPASADPMAAPCLDHQIWKRRLVKIELSGCRHCCQYFPGIGHKIFVATHDCIRLQALNRQHESQYVVAAVFNSRPLPACLPLYNAADYRAAPRGWAAYQFSGSQMCDVRELCKAHNGLPSTCLK